MLSPKLRRGKHSKFHDSDYESGAPYALCFVLERGWGDFQEGDGCGNGHSTFAVTGSEIEVAEANIMKLTDLEILSLSTNTEEIDYAELWRHRISR